MNTLLLSTYLSTSLKAYGVLCLYIMVNSLFIIKYGEPYSLLLLTGYWIIVSGAGICYLKVAVKEKFYQRCFWVVTAVFFFFSLYLNYSVDGYSLNVDRWSAMETGIKAVLNGQYPYNIPDHMGQESSNLPVLIVLGMPFYLLFGSVGYLQSFIFLLFSYIVFVLFRTYRQRVAVLSLLMISPAYVWEIYVKSDLASNFIIVAGFTVLVWNRFMVRPTMRPEIVSTLSALILLTRLSSVIPIVILLFRRFYLSSVKEKLRYTIVFFVMVSVILYFFFHLSPDFYTIFKHNPFLIQGAKQPLWLSISYIILSFVLSMKARSIYDIFLFSGILLFICVCIPFSLCLAEYGYAETITNSFFDISFFNMSMPFIIITLGMVFLINPYEEKP